MAPITTRILTRVAGLSALTIALAPVSIAGASEPSSMKPASDTTAPVLISAVVPPQGYPMILTFSEDIAGGPSAQEDFSIDAEGLAIGVTDISIDGATITLGLEYYIFNTGLYSGGSSAVTIDYQPTAGQALTDVAGNPVAAFVDVVVTNNSTATAEGPGEEPTTTTAPATDSTTTVPDESAGELPATGTDRSMLTVALALVAIGIGATLARRPVRSN